MKNTSVMSGRDEVASPEIFRKMKKVVAEFGLEYYVICRQKLEK